MSTAQDLADTLKAAQHLVFMTGAGVSTASGIPDYRSMTGIYTTSGLKQPEYLLSHRAMLADTDDWYAFVRQLYHPDAAPNLIHRAMASLGAPIITQNIDGLHKKAGSRDVTEFHGSIATHYCLKCGAAVTAETFLASYVHAGCGGILRPDVVFYDEPIAPDNITHAVQTLATADVVAIVGTTFKVYPFAGLIDYANPSAQIIAINRDAVAVPGLSAAYQGDAIDVFKLL